MSIVQSISPPNSAFSSQKYCPGPCQQLHDAVFTGYRSRITAGMFTSFYDALLLAAREQFKPDRRRHAVVVLTDGMDSGRGDAFGEMA